MIIGKFNSAVNFWQPIGNGRRSMSLTWRARPCGRYIVIGQRGRHIPGCFSIRMVGDKLDAAWHEFHSPAMVLNHLCGDEDQAITANAIYFEIADTNKYLEVGLLRFLIEKELTSFLPDIVT